MGQHITEAQESRSLGYAHWPERAAPVAPLPSQSRSLGYAHWPEQAHCVNDYAAKSRSLGYAHWPELEVGRLRRCKSLDHWDMRTGRNTPIHTEDSMSSLDHWDMRTGRN